jgi:hypothetical protein
MPTIHYLAELDRVNVKKTLCPIVQDMDEQELRVALLYILHGTDVYDAIDSARGFSRKETEFERQLNAGEEKLDEKIIKGVDGYGVSFNQLRDL